MTDSLPPPPPASPSTPDLVENLAEAGKSIWLPCPREVWSLGEIISSVDDSIKVLRDGVSSTLPISSTSVHDPSHDLDLEDISCLNNLSEAPLLHLLQRRFKNNSIYTYCGHVLISVNPYQIIPNLYGTQRYDEEAELINDDEEFDMPTVHRSSVSGRGNGITGPPPVSSGGSENDGAFLVPHVYSIARTAFSHMVSSQKNQSVIISGESGAGKTEASKHVMKYLIDKSSSMVNSAVPDSLGDEIQGRLMESNVILEAFGNAKTLRNDNSSRFGKYIKLKYDSSSKIVGASTEVRTFFFVSCWRE